MHEGKTRRGNKFSDVNYPWVDFKSQAVNQFISKSKRFYAGTSYSMWSLNCSYSYVLVPNPDAVSCCFLADYFDIELKNTFLSFNVFCIIIIRPSIRNGSAINFYVVFQAVYIFGDASSSSQLSWSRHCSRFVAVLLGSRKNGPVLFCCFSWFGLEPWSYSGGCQKHTEVT